MQVSKYMVKWYASVFALLFVPNTRERTGLLGWSTPQFDDGRIETLPSKPTFITSCVLNPLDIHSIILLYP